MNKDDLIKEAEIVVMNGLNGLAACAAGIYSGPLVPDPFVQAIVALAEKWALDSYEEMMVARREHEEDVEALQQTIKELRELVK